MIKRTLKTVLAFCLLFSLVACQKNQESDNLRFKTEYESLNKQKNEDGETYCEIEIPKENKIMYVSSERLLEGLENGTHVVYFGWPSCQWCRRAIPVLIDAVNQYSGIYIYYYNLKADREEYESSNSGFYQQVIECLNKDDFDLSPYVSYYEDGSMKIPSSLVLFIKDGEIIGAHRRTGDSHLSAYEPLDQQQYEQLINIYSWYLDELVKKVPIGCSDSCD